MPLAGRIVLPQFNCFNFAVRLESRCRNEDSVQQGLEARIADPLWMLARQWQMGEFISEDNGSPIRINVDYEIAEINELIKGGEPQSINGYADPPLEALVERESWCMDWTNRVRSGQQFERFLRIELRKGGDLAKADTVINYFRKEKLNIDHSETFSADQATQRFVRLMAGKSIDGKKALESIWADNPLLPPDRFNIDEEQVKRAYAALAIWYQRLFSQPEEGEETAWKPPQLEYEFELSTRSDDAEGSMATKLLAPDYRNGDLDWYTCEIKQQPNNLSGAVACSATFNPTRVSFAGKPNERWWTMEDHNVNLAKLSPSIDELSKLLLVDFALIHADDWFHFPLELPYGSLARIKKIEVENVFNDPCLKIEPALVRGENELHDFELFTLSNQNYTNNKNPLFFIPPTPGDREESTAIEEVRFIRDEGANMVFAIEHSVQNGLGNPVAGFEARLEQHENEVKEEIDALSENAEVSQSETEYPRYRLASSVPDNWFPYIPVKANNSNLLHTNDASIRLRQAMMMRNDEEEEPKAIPPMSRILSGRPTGSPLIWLNEESVPREGVKVQLTRQRVRWIDGKTHVWLGRKVKSGKGEGSSGLKFDYLLEKKG